MVYYATPVVDHVAELGESPVWDPCIGLLWLDVPKKLLLHIGLDGKCELRSLPRELTAVAPTTTRDLLVVTTDGFGVLDVEKYCVEPVATILDDASISMNDGAVDAHGRYWAGSAVRDQTFRGSLYCLDRTGPRKVIDQIGMSNGLDWSPDWKTLYHVDSASGVVRAWHYNLDYALVSDPRLLRVISPDIGIPDGLTVDNRGNIWLAVWGTGQIWSLDARDGRTQAIVEVPTPYVTSCVFGGDDLSILYVTTADYNGAEGGGVLYSVELPVRGRYTERFMLAGK
ncbi:SMP-30/gluconolactonase/LRE family protein [Saccharomonospora sp. NPDC046836]|uniref:SMP-30/gluconolactonase/LRE family protein n=1 Tax=Saccharomonospora sp. NPDC046836 TaxID=3156921 RepID=UPI003407C4C0